MTLEYFDAGGFLRPGPTGQEWQRFTQWVESVNLVETIKLTADGVSENPDQIVSELQAARNAGVTPPADLADVAKDLLEAAAEADLLLIISEETGDAEG